MNDAQAHPTPLLLSPTEARVVATLMEKARTVPDSYPLSVHALTLGCNQKTSREPVMNLSETDVTQALASLRQRHLVGEVSGSRTPRFQHNFQRGAGVNEQSAVLLGLLMLRGPQTVAELRLNAERWYHFADNSSVASFLEELQERVADKGGPLVALLPKPPGAREARWAHLLCGPVDPSALGHAAPNTQERLSALESEVARLRATIALLCTELGVDGAERAT